MRYTIFPSPLNNDSQLCHCSPNIAIDYLDERFSNWCFTNKGREGIAIALRLLGAKKDDVVTILTTSENFYISSCVTNTIETVCKWNREITSETTILFINHEFGYPFEGIADYKKYGLPIIEDCAYDFFSVSQDGDIGKIGDFVIYSLTKAFPIESGGLLVCNNSEFDVSSECNQHNHNQAAQLASYVNQIEYIKSKRLENYSFLENELSSLGIKPYFELKEGVVPGPFLFSWHDYIDYPEFKKYMYSVGIESSVFYGKSAYFIPMHHLLQEEDLKYICCKIKEFAKKNDIR